MKNLTLENITKACGGQYIGPEENLKKEINGAVIDSRQVEADYLFIATKGARVDGHSFIPAVFEKGALCVIAERELSAEEIGKENASIIVVKDSFQALKDIATFYRQQLSTKIIGITGSVGKTSTKEMMAGVLSAKYSVLKTLGNFNNEVGLPLTVLRIRQEEVAVLEMGISDFGEMSRLTAIARPDICVITNIGQCHLENLGTRDGILKAKTEIFEGLSDEGYAVLNGEDDKLITVKDVHGKSPLFFGDDSCYATDIVSKGLLGTCAKLHLLDASGQEIMVVNADISVPGGHQVINALAAFRVANLLGLTKEEIEAGIAKVEAIGGRNHIIQGSHYTIIDDCYNANPVSMKASLDLLSLAKGRKVAILGDMFELGTDSDVLHASVGEYLDTSKADVLICIGENAEHIFNGAKDFSGMKYYFVSKDAFLAEKPKETILQDGDNVLLKASHGMAFETLIPVLSE